jgi:hypothetical protein
MRLSYLWSVRMSTSGGMYARTNQLAFIRPLFATAGTTSRAGETRLSQLRAYDSTRVVFSMSYTEFPGKVGVPSQ